MQSKTSSSRILVSRGLVLTFLLWGSLAQAGDDVPPAKVATSTASPSFASTARVADSDLKAIAGKADVSQSVIAQNTSTVSGNSVSGQSSTGTVNFSAEAFSQLRGLALVSANTGNNVSINSSMNVTVALQR